MADDARTPLTLCHECGTVLCHAGEDRLAVAREHEATEHPGTGGLFTDLGRDPYVLLARPRTVRG